MKYIKNFENNTDKHYVIALTIDNKLGVSVEFKNGNVNSYPFQYVDIFDYDNFKIKYYTKQEAIDTIQNIVKHYALSDSKNLQVIPKEDLEVLINSQKYNL